MLKYRLKKHARHEKEKGKPKHKQKKNVKQKGTVDAAKARPSTVSAGQG